MMNIAVAGTGYVGMSIATLLSQHNHVVAVDVIPEKVEKINKRISPIQDDYIEKYLSEKKLDLTATLDGASAYKDADYVVIAAPTNYDPQKNFFDRHRFIVVEYHLLNTQVYLLLCPLTNGCRGVQLWAYATKYGLVNLNSYCTHNGYLWLDVRN